MIDDDKDVNDSNAEEYVTYPDPIIHFAYRLTQPSITDALDNFIKLFPEAYSILIDNPNQYIILYPPLGDNLNDANFRLHKKLIEQIGYIQYLINRGDNKSETKFNEESLNILSRIYLGSPHLFYRWLVKNRGSNPNYQVTELPPNYPNNNNDDDNNSSDYLPLDDSLMLIISSSKEGSSKESKIRTSRDVNTNVNTNVNGNINIGSVKAKRRLSNKDDNDNPKSYFTYCGDSQAEWERAFKFGKAGDFKKCHELYTLQFPRQLDNRLTTTFGAPIIISTTTPVIIQTQSMSALSSPLTQQQQQTTQEEIKKLQLETQAMNLRQRQLSNLYLKSQQKYDIAKSRLAKLQNLK